MSRSICTVFVALAIFQDAFAINVEPRMVINLAMTNRTSPTIKLSDGERASRFIGDTTVGNRSEHYYYEDMPITFENWINRTLNSEMTFRSRQAGRKIHYFSAVNKEGSTAAFCVDESTLGSDAIVVNARFPALSVSGILFTTGLDNIPNSSTNSSTNSSSNPSSNSSPNSSSVKSIQALLIPFAVITLLLTNFHL